MLLSNFRQQAHGGGLAGLGSIGLGCGDKSDCGCGCSGHDAGHGMGDLGSDSSDCARGIADACTRYYATYNAAQSGPSVPASVTSNPAYVDPSAYRANYTAGGCPVISGSGMQSLCAYGANGTIGCSELRECDSITGFDHHEYALPGTSPNVNINQVDAATGAFIRYIGNPSNPQATSPVNAAGVIPNAATTPTTTQTTANYQAPNTTAAIPQYQAVGPQVSPQMQLPVSSGGTSGGTVTASAESFFSEATDWVTNNPWLAAGIGAAAFFLLKGKH